MLHRGQKILASLILIPLFSSCEGLPPDGFEVVEGEQAMVYEIDFNPRPAYMKNNELVLTFDDGPDGTYTARVLDILKEKGVKASFFYNSNNNSNLDTSVAAQNLVKRTFAEGHEMASHTARHIDLAVQTPAGVEQELAGVENAMLKILGPTGPKMTLVRAPFGRPYQSAYGSADYKKVSAVMAKHAVHVGWNLDSNDWMFNGDADRVYNNVVGLIKTPGQGAYGVILMHSINPQTVGALPRLIDYMKMNGFVFKTVEDAVRGKYNGKTSAELLGMAPAGGTGGTGGSGGAGGTGGDSGTGGVTGTGGASGVDAGADASSSGGGTGGATSTPDAGRPATGGSGGSKGTGGSPGTGGDEPDPDPPGTTGANSGGCSFGGTPQGYGIVLLAAAAALLRRARRRS